MLAPPTPEQHTALLREILAEMTPEQLAETMKPIDWEKEFSAPIDLQLEPQPVRFDLLYRAVIVNPFVVC